MYRDFVDRYHFLTEDEFMSALTISQILPGPNVANLAFHIGQKLRCGLGGLVSVMALLVPPMILAVLLSIVLLDLGLMPCTLPGRLLARKLPFFLSNVKCALVGIQI